MGDDVFLPPQLTVPAGTSVTWVNFGQNVHTATAQDGAFASPTLLFGRRWTYTFTARGAYAYVCLYHPGMTGQLVVD